MGHSWSPISGRYRAVARLGSSVRSDLETARDPGDGGAHRVEQVRRRSPEQRREVEPSAE